MVLFPEGKITKKRHSPSFMECTAGDKLGKAVATALQGKQRIHYYGMP